MLGTAFWTSGAGFVSSDISRIPDIRSTRRCTGPSCTGCTALLRKGQIIAMLNPDKPSVKIKLRMNNAGNPTTRMATNPRLMRITHRSQCYLISAQDPLAKEIMAGSLMQTLDCSDRPCASQLKRAPIGLIACKNLFYGTHPGPDVHDDRDNAPNRRINLTIFRRLALSPRTNPLSSRG
jgi:hypothetical protein